MSRLQRHGGGFKLKRGVLMTLNQVFNGSSVKEVIELLSEHKDEAKLIAGGTDLVVAIKEGKTDPKVMIDVSKIEELRQIKSNNNEIEIGSAVTYTEVIESELFNRNLHGLIKACRMVGSPQIRNKGTLGGNIANLAPAADSIPPLIALDARLEIGSLRGYREVSIADFFSSNKEYGLKSDELIISIKFPKPKENQFLSFSKLGLRKALAISRVTVSTLVEVENKKIKNIVVASGSIGKYPMREPEVEEALIGKTYDDDILDLAVNSLQNSMDERLKGRSTLPYKRQAIVSLFEEALEETDCYYSEVNI